MMIVAMTAEGCVHELEAFEYFAALAELHKLNNSPSYWNTKLTKLIVDGEIRIVENADKLAAAFVEARNKAVHFATRVVEEEYKPKWLESVA